MKLAVNNTQFNIVLLISIVGLSILSISWHHQTYTLYKQLKRATLDNHQIVALNKQLLSEHSQVVSGTEIRESALIILNMKEVEEKDKGKWFNGNIAL